MIDPRLKILLLIMAGTLAIVLDSIVSLGCLSLLCLTSLFLAGVTRQWKFRGVILVSAIVWSTVLSQSLFYGLEPRTPLLELGPLVFWRALE